MPKHLQQLRLLCWQNLKYPSLTNRHRNRGLAELMAIYPAAISVKVVAVFSTAIARPTIARSMSALSALVAGVKKPCCRVQNLVHETVSPVNTIVTNACAATFATCAHCVMSFQLVRWSLGNKQCSVQNRPGSMLSRSQGIASAGFSASYVLFTKSS